MKYSGHMLLLSLIAFLGGCRAATQSTLPRPSATLSAECGVANATPWMEKWFAAWKLTSREILRVPDIPTPHMVFFDAKCLYTTSEITAPVPGVRGPSPGTDSLVWRSALHGDTLTQPNGSKIPVVLTSFTNIDKNTGRPYFVMSAPSYWELRGVPGDVTPVFLHEFAHTRQVRGMGRIIGAIDANWKYPDELDDDAVQTHFKGDSLYVKAYMAERDLFYRAANAGTIDEVRAFAKQGLDMMRARHARWFTGDEEVFAVLDDTFLSLEGAGQWTAYAWLTHPQGGGMKKPAAIARMLGSRRFWAQDEGLGIFLVVDRLLPDWPALVFNDPSAGVIELLEAAMRGQSSESRI